MFHGTRSIPSSFLMYHVREFEVTNNQVEVDHEVQPSLSSEGSDAGPSPVVRSDTRDSSGKGYGRKILPDHIHWDERTSLTQGTLE